MNTPPYALIASFIAFTESQSMEKAAGKLGLSQPALTSHLKQFEQHFPQPVFEFKGRRKILTPFGEDLKKFFALRFSNLEKDLELVLEKTLAPAQALVRIAARHEILFLLAPKISFAGSLQLIPIPSEDGVMGLLNRDFDFAITYVLTDTSELHAKELFKYDYSLIIPKSWGLGRKKICRELLVSLLAFPLISHRHQSENWDKIASKFKIKESPLYKKIIPDWRAIIQLVENQEGWSIVPTYFAQNNDAFDSILLPTSLVNEVQFYLVYRAETAKRFWFKELSSLLKKIFVY